MSTLTGTFSQQCFSVTHIGLGKLKACSYSYDKTWMSLEKFPCLLERTHSSTHRTNLETYHAGFGENHLVQLIYHQNANGSWDLNEDLAKVLGVSLEEITAAHPAELVDSSGWATILAVIWLHGNGKDLKCEWELLERKAMAWMRVHAGSTMPLVVKAAITFLKSSVDPAIFAF